MELFTSYFQSAFVDLFTFRYVANMLSRFRNAIYTAVGNLDPSPAIKDGETREARPLKFPYKRPHFLQLDSEDEIQVSADHVIRPIIVPRDINKMPWNSGYAETINAGKSLRNEDQGRIHVGLLFLPQRHVNRSSSVRNGHREEFSPPHTSPERDNNPNHIISYKYFALFDGHAGSGAAVAAANQLHHIVHEKLVDIVHHLLPPDRTSPQVFTTEGTGRHSGVMWFPDREISRDNFIIGALEAAFHEMDGLIAEDRLKYKMNGGCTALVGLFILGKLYLANAGDSRAVISHGGKVIPMSNDFTPETESQRVRQLAALQPELLGGEYSYLDYCRRPVRKDVGKRLLYREPHMTGWCYKHIKEEDLKFPVVYGEGKRSRVLATIGVTRGFGDHDLKAQYSNIAIKPFLSSQPEVLVFNVEEKDLVDTDVLVMGTDGLWDITSNEKSAEIVAKSLQLFPSTDPLRYKYRAATAAQDLVLHSRGKFHERNWRTVDDKSATIDDISVFVIPLLPYKVEYKLWLERCHKANEAIHQAPSNVTPPTANVPTIPITNGDTFSEINSSDIIDVEVNDILANDGVENDIAQLDVTPT